MTAAHWESVYRTKAEDEVSWFEESPQASLDAIAAVGLKPTDSSSAAAVDIGAGRSSLAVALLELGWHPVIALDISSTALEQLADRTSDGLICVASDVLSWQPDRRVGLWHDRAVFHFLTEPADQAAYADLAARTVVPGGIVVLATFAPDGPEQCSGLPTARHDAASLERTFSPAFALQRQQRIEHRTPWGAIQPFTCVVLRRQGAD